VPASKVWPQEDKRTQCTAAVAPFPAPGELSVARGPFAHRASHRNTLPRFPDATKVFPLVPGTNDTSSKPLFPSLRRVPVAPKPLLLLLVLLVVTNLTCRPTLASRISTASASPEAVAMHPPPSAPSSPPHATDDSVRVTLPLSPKPLRTQSGSNRSPLLNLSVSTRNKQSPPLAVAETNR